MSPVPDPIAPESPDAVRSDPEPGTVSEAFVRAVSAWAHEPFLDRNGNWLTYEQTAREVAAVAGGLAGLGVAPGDRVVVALRDGVDAVVTWLAADSIGGVTVPIAPGTGPDHVRRIVRDCQPRVIVTEPDTGEPVAGPAPEETPAALTLDALRVGPAAPAPAANAGRPGHVALVAYDMRPDGAFGGALVTQGQLTHTAEQMLELTGWERDEVYWCGLPAVAAETLATVVVPAILIGAAVSLATVPGASDIWGDLHRTGARLAGLTDRMMAAAALRSESKEELCCRGQIRVVTGACPPADLQDLWSARFGVEVPGLPYYWRPEAGLLAAVPCGEYSPAGSAGRRQPAYDVRILAGDDDEVLPGEVGEIVCRPRCPHTLFKGYWNQPERTVAATANLWFHTGEQGRIDAEGFLYLERAPVAEPAPVGVASAPRLRRVPDPDRAG